MENQRTNIETGLTNDVKDMSLLVNKPYVAYVFKKTQKISQALYLITDFFDPLEPLRESVRKNANLLLQSAGNLLRNDQKDTHSAAHSLIGYFLETLALIDTAKLISLISDNNHRILSEEMDHVMREVETNREKKIQLSKEFIATPTIEDYKRQSVPYKGQESVLNIKDTEYRPVKKDITATPSSKAQRSVQVISLFKPGVELTIKDISSHLKDVSEKTIQRELLSLVFKGMLRKKGERRWSRYSLI